MTQHSEERLPETEGEPSVRAGARILPFERPQSELQRAIQLRAQETIDLNRERDREKRRPQPLKWLAIFALACVPVALTLGAVDGFLRVFHQVTATFSSTPAPQAQQQEARAGRGAVHARHRDAGVLRSATGGGAQRDIPSREFPATRPALAVPLTGHKHPQ